MEIVHKYKQSITWHGKVGHQELADWFMKCGFWLYPTDFPEISCITAMKAQASGCWPVCNDFAALKETVKFGTITKGLPPECLPEWLESVKRASTEATPQARAIMREWALKNLSWETLVQEWTGLFNGMLEEKKAVRV
jgi:glycosyltransferase involved in cell wall biosynthesis